MMNIHDQNRDCHPSLREGSVAKGGETLRCAKGDKRPAMITGLAC